MLPVAANGALKDHLNVPYVQSKGHRGQVPRHSLGAQSLGSALFALLLPADPCPLRLSLFPLICSSPLAFQPGMWSSPSGINLLAAFRSNEPSALGHPTSGHFR